MKKVSQILLIVFVLVAFIAVFAGPSSAAEPKKYKLRYSAFLSSTAWGPTNTIKPWFKQVEKATNGQVVFEPYWAGSLAKSPATWGAMKKGIVDIGEVSFHYTRGLVVLHNVLTLPFLEYDSAEHESIVAWKLYEKFPEIRNEYKDNKVLLFFCSTPFFFVSRDNQIKSREGFKGLKVRVVGGESLQFMVESGGGIPMRVAGGEIYSSLEKGVIDATVANWDMVASYRLYEVAKYYFFGPFNAGARGVCMSHQAWNSLTPDLQQKMMSVSGLAGSRFWGRTTYDESVEPVQKKIRSQGYEMIETTLPPEKAKEWKDLYGEKGWESYIKMAVKSAKSKGYPDPEGLVNKLIAATQELIETTRK